jgi:tetratricopeptide (TPR) repeat protein
MADALPLRIFLASPAGLEAERELVRSCVAEFNSGNRHSVINYEVVGWERVRGTARRPQEAINELIGESHFLVALLRDRWGSAPGSPWGYTSGTEEELFSALLDLGLAEQPMRDVWVAFLAHEAPDERVCGLQRQMANHHSMLYESIADVRDLKDKLTERLETWASAAQVKVPQHIDLLPSSGKDVLRAANLRLRGQKLVQLGQPDAGLAALRASAVLGGPIEHLAFAQQQARDGDLEGAIASTQAAIDYFTSGDGSLYTSLAAEAFAAQAGLLRRQGRIIDAAGRLEQALTLVGEHDSTAVKARCRILDELGLAYQRLGDLDLARTHFETALGARRDAALEFDECQSLVNLARLEVAAGNLPAASAHAEHVLDVLRATPASALHANAEILVAQIRIRQGRFADGLPHATRALAVNQQIANKRGEAISLNILAQCSLGAGDSSAGRRHLIACIDVNEAMGNEDGVQQARRLLDPIET